MEALVSSGSGTPRSPTACFSQRSHRQPPSVLSTPCLFCPFLASSSFFSLHRGMRIQETSTNLGNATAYGQVWCVITFMVSTVICCFRPNGPLEGPDSCLRSLGGPQKISTSRAGEEGGNGELHSEPPAYGVGGVDPQWGYFNSRRPCGSFHQLCRASVAHLFYPFWYL